MNHWVDVFNKTQKNQKLARARWCASYGCRLRGLMFRRPLQPGVGLLLVDSKESRAGASIHMWGVFFPLGVVWLDEGRRAVDRVLARPWRIYTPKAAAKFILEAEPSVLDGVRIGDQLEFVDATDV
jgi:hypothetical protein